MILDKKLQDKIRWFPHEGQAKVLDNKSKEIIICAGRGWGKSQTAAYLVVRTFLNKLNEIRKGNEQDCKIWIVAPTYELSNKVFNNVVTFLLAYDKKFGQHVTGRTPANITLAENIWIQCKSTTEPMGMLGERLDLAVIDEAAMIPETIYNQYVRPTVLTDRGKAIYISTPRGKNWFQKKWYILEEKGSAFKFISTENPTTGAYSAEALEELQHEYPEILFKQEFLAEFVSDAGIVFRGLPDVTYPAQQLLQDGKSGHHYVMGIDLAEINDYTVITVIDSETYEVVHQDRFKDRDYPLQKEHIMAKARRYNNARITLDTTGVGRPIYEDLRRAGVFVEDYTFSGKSKEELIGKLIVFLEEKYVKIPDIPVLLSELEAFEYQYINEKTGERLKTVKYGAPKGFHDDCVDSLALAVWGLVSTKPTKADPIAVELAKGQKELKKRTLTYI